jgi:undecaprenyl-phosphate galactose phosphotransferase
MSSAGSLRFIKGLLAGLVMVIFDIAALVGSYILAYVLRLTWVWDIAPGLPPPQSFENFSERSYLLLIYLLVFAYEGLYTRRLVLAEEFRRILRGVMLATGLTIMALFVTRTWILSRSVVLLAMLVLVVVLPVFRTIAKQLAIALRLWSRRVVIVGQDRNAQILKAELRRHWRLGYQVAAVTDSQTLRQMTSSDVVELLARDRAESFVLSDASVARTDASRLLSSPDAPGHEVIILLDSTTLQTVGVEVEQLESLLLMKYRYNLLQPFNILLKRVLDLLVTTIGLVALLPAFGFIALIIRLTSPGPVFFLQDRFGRNRRIFRCIKFRTMRRDADERLERLLAADPTRQAEWQKYSRITDDPRITRFGRFLRRFSLDEFPQLWNVLRGEMSLVGPRPYMPRESDKIGSFLDIITRVQPGLTGPYQVSGRKELTFEERLLLDEHYVRNWSLWMDIVLLTRTLRVVLQGSGAS